MPTPPSRLTSSSNSFGLTYCWASVWAVLEGLLELLDLLRVGAARVLGLLPRHVGGVHLLERRAFLGPVGRADDARALEGHVLGHVGEPGHALRVLRRADVGLGGEREDRRAGPLADDERPPVRQHVHGRARLERGEVLGGGVGQPAGREQEGDEQARRAEAPEARRRKVRDMPRIICFAGGRAAHAGRRADQLTGRARPSGRPSGAGPRCRSGRRSGPCRRRRRTPSTAAPGAAPGSARSCGCCGG